MASHDGFNFPQISLIYLMTPYLKSHPICSVPPLKRDIKEKKMASPNNLAPNPQPVGNHLVAAENGHLGGNQPRVVNVVLPPEAGVFADPRPLLVGFNRLLPVTDLEYFSTTGSRLNQNFARHALQVSNCFIVSFSVQLLLALISLLPLQSGPGLYQRSYFALRGSLS